MAKRRRSAHLSRTSASLPEADIKNWMSCVDSSHPTALNRFCANQIILLMQPPNQTSPTLAPKTAAGLFFLCIPPIRDLRRCSVSKRGNISECAILTHLSNAIPSSALSQQRAELPFGLSLMGEKIWMGPVDRGIVHRPRKPRPKPARGGAFLLPRRPRR